MLIVGCRDMYPIQSLFPVDQINSFESIDHFLVSKMISATIVYSYVVKIVYIFHTFNQTTSFCTLQRPRNVVLVVITSLNF